MRAVNAYLLFPQTRFSDTEILVWMLSVIMNRRAGFTTVLYTNEESKKKLDEYHITDLYDEIDTEAFRTSGKLNLIDKQIFWAAPKFVAIEKEVERGEPFFMLDTDLCLMDASHFKEMLNTENLIVWSNSESALTYRPLGDMPLRSSYKYPDGIQSTIRPVTMAIIYIKNIEITKVGLDAAWNFMFNFTGTKYNPAYICTVEQRFLPNAAEKFNEKISFFENQGNPNGGKEHFHVGGDKGRITKVERIKRTFTRGLLELIKFYDYNHFEVLKGMKELLPLTDEVIRHGNHLPVDKTLQIYVDNIK